MIDKQIIAYLKLIHGAFNALVMLLLIYQGWFGLRIRNIRRAGKPPDFRMIKRHRKNGPLFHYIRMPGIYCRNNNCLP